MLRSAQRIARQLEVQAVATRQQVSRIKAKGAAAARKREKARADAATRGANRDANRANGTKRRRPTGEPLHTGERKRQQCAATTSS